MSALNATDLLNSLGIAGPNIRHAIADPLDPKPVPGMYFTPNDDRECVCGRVWPCEALQLAELVALIADPLSPQWEDCKICGGDHWTKDHPDLRLPPEEQGPMPPDRTAPIAPNDGTRVRHMTETLIASLIHQHVSDRLERRALTDAIDAMPDAAPEELTGLEWSGTRPDVVFGVDQLPHGHRWPDDPPPPVHPLLEGGYCQTCSGSCLIGFGNP